MVVINTKKNIQKGTDICNRKKQKILKISCFSESRKKSLSDSSVRIREVQKNIYTVEVKTGKKKNAGTDAMVYIELIGEKKGIGKIKLDTVDYNDTEEGALDSYTISSPDIGNLKSIKIGHDNSGSKPGWYLEYVNLTLRGENKTTWNFPVNRWLEKDHTEVELFVEK